MIDIFIPVIMLCMNGNCEFMQTHKYYLNESQCRQQIDAQKQVMIKQASSSPVPIDILEGTCITAKIEDTRGKV
jgi:hypothetical protein